MVNLSQTGAKIAIQLRRTLPKRFVVRFTANAAIAIICKPIWEREGAIGVQFLDRVASPPKADDASGHAGWKALRFDLTENAVPPCSP